ncbi:hypothetical protein HPP92_002514 [Vanilla planifolia]|uniref:Uncharacterized protein n=1 Tax=Vanilla planifolia TaxID=51239 RepID=A0A835S5M4_VANPL|nr:hypothetical protein HPP92_002514 [Vanilla planifolia]
MGEQLAVWMLKQQVIDAVNKSYGINDNIGIIGDNQREEDEGKGGEAKVICGINLDHSSR